SDRRRPAATGAGGLRAMARERPAAPSLSAAAAARADSDDADPAATAAAADGYPAASAAAAAGAATSAAAANPVDRPAATAAASPAGADSAAGAAPSLSARTRSFTRLAHAARRAAALAPDWQAWVAENLLLGLAPSALVETLVANGVARTIATREVRAI